jgi:hypothetical protein
LLSRLHRTPLYDGGDGASLRSRCEAHRLSLHEFDAVPGSAGLFHAAVSVFRTRSARRSDQRAAPGVGCRPRS